MKKNAGLLNSEPRFTYLEFIEFASAKEFRRFKNLPPISSCDIESVDWDVLEEELQDSSL